MRCNFMPFVKLPHIFLIHPVNHDISLSKCIGSCLDSTILVKCCFHSIFVKQCDQPSILFYSVIIAESDRFLLTIPHNNYHAFP